MQKCRDNDAHVPLEIILTLFAAFIDGLPLERLIIDRCAFVSIRLRFVGSETFSIGRQVGSLAVVVLLVDTNKKCMIERMNSAHGSY